MTDENAIVDAVLDDNVEAVAGYLEGEPGAMNYLVGRILSRSSGKIRPERARELAEERIAVRTDESEDDDEGGRTVLEAGDRVDISQNGFQRVPTFEHERATIKTENVSVRPGLNSRFKLQQRQKKPMTARDLIEQAIGPSRPGKGSMIEIVSYPPGRVHDEVTYYHVVFESGGQGVYPESCLVPAPEVALR